MLKRLSEKYQQWNYYRKSKKTQHYSYGGLMIKVLPGVFSPEGTRTTELLADYLLQFDWREKRVLELGAGSGLISFLLSKKGATVTASDISENAVRGLKENSSELNLDIQVVHSNLFDDLKEVFDIVIINPPFFQKDPIDIAEKAWYCGANFEFFEELFLQFSMREYDEKMWMILSERTEMNRILQIAKRNHLFVKKRDELIVSKEEHIVYEIASEANTELD